MASVSARRAKAISLIKGGLIHSQSDLVEELKKAGFAVTQATASRDLEEIGAVRGRSATGDSVYTISASGEASLSRSMPLPSELILSVESSGNLAVIHTPPGGAQLLASSLDHSGISSIIGTIAGDDTVLVVARKASGGAQLAKELLSYGQVKKIRGRKIMVLWGGGFSQSPAEAVFALSQSVQFDWRLAPYDLRSSLAHLAVLESSGLLDKKVAAAIRKALGELVADVASGKFTYLATDEDVHSALERGLTEKLGEIGGALRAGRSRNDQVATDLRLYAIDAMISIALSMAELQEALIAKATEYSDAPAPGFTHLQHAQPVLFGHEIAKHVHAFARDLDRIQDWLTRTSVSPLGSGALAGSSLPLAPEVTAKALGFTSSAANSIDAVSDRDFVAEALFILSMVGVHLSRIGEEWCIWSTTEFGWARISDAYSTGSSIMPQKKNPDMAELARGKSGRLIGNLTGVLAMLKGLPFAYNRDLQEDKEPLFDSIDTVLLLLPALTGMVATTEFDREKMALAAPLGFSLATEIADYLVRAYIPFAQAHEAAGKCVALCEASGRQLHQLTDDEFAKIHPALKGDVRDVLTVQGALASRTTRGGTAPSSLSQQLSEAKSSLEKTRSEFTAAAKAFSTMMGA